MALALSASMAQPTSDNVSTATKDTVSSEKPMPSVRQGAKKKTNAKTVLEVRTEENRDRQVGEQVAAILAEGEEQTVGTGRQLWRPQGPRITDNFPSCDSSARMWNAAALTSQHACDYQNGVLDKTVAKETPPEKVPESTGSASSGMVHVDELSRCWEKIFLSNPGDCDVEVHTRDQDDCIRCHSLVLLARCKDILDEVTTETCRTRDGISSKKIISWPSVSKEAAETFMLYLYSGKVATVETKSAYDGLLMLSRKYEQKLLLHELESSVDKDLLVPESEEEEWLELKKEDVPQPQEEQRTPTSSPQTVAQVEEEVDGFCLPPSPVAGKEMFDDNDGDQTFSAENEWKDLQGRDGDGSCFASTKNQDLMLTNSSSERLQDCNDETVSGEESLLKRSSKLEQKDYATSSGASQKSHCAGSPLRVACGADTPNHEAENRVLGSVEQNDSDEDFFAVSSLKEADEMKKPESCSLSKRRSMNSSNESVDNGDDGIWDDFDCDGGGDIVLGECNSSSPDVLATCPAPLGCKSPPEHPEFKSSSQPSVRAAHVDTPLNGKELLPDYERMLSPALRNELKKFGLKVIPRRKAITLLKHIHKEINRRQKVATSSPKANRLECDLPQGEKTPNSSQESLSSSASNVVMEESLLLGNELEELDDDAELGAGALSTQQRKSRTQTLATGTELSRMMKEYFTSVDAFRKDILLYRPIWLEDCFASFKASLGIKCKLEEFTSVLDAECITFRTRASSNRRYQKSRKK